MNALEKIKELQNRINQSIIGQSGVVEKILVVFLADGNLLLEGLPGLAKTRAIKSLSKELRASLSRIQFTPDLLPSDITGTEIFQPELKDPFVFKKGPIFANLVLADEINRAPAKVQAALLEAMEERQVTVAGKTYKMEDLFLVMATQNPVEQEGTYPLPEAQMDRFLMKILMEYPDSESEEKILELVSAESRGEFITNKPISQEVVFKAREEIKKIEVSKASRKYIVDLINATRNPSKYSEDLDRWIDFGASPRGTIALEKCARVMAWLNERTYIEPDDVREVIHEVLRHRLILSYEANAQRVSPDQVIDELVKSVAVL
ncbi:AAA family ATPase [Carboxylicivirga sp. N1Y90]|uniref:AAA family ATPase n=1 Tax=Carboxylicivirga fragile TaxID=3417571 RepID=UPI003D349E46|nr:MoxR family ATPase [Marinilabiliaceae bacterium N1Y90]